jgi:hypothetical protein
LVSPHFRREDGWSPTRSRFAFNKGAYNKGQFGTSAAPYNLVTAEEMNHFANQALTAMDGDFARRQAGTESKDNKEKEGPHTSKMGAVFQRALRMISAPLRTAVTNAHTHALKYGNGNPTQKANLVLALEGGVAGRDQEEPRRNAKQHGHPRCLKTRLLRPRWLYCCSRAGLLRPR